MIRGADATSDTIPATLTAMQAAAIEWQIIIVGAGPAGAAAAQRCAERGVRVLLIDRSAMPRWKVCGCCLSVTAMRELQALGYRDARASSAPLQATPLGGVQLAAGGRIAVREFPGGGVMSRETLDATLVRAAIARGCHWLPQASVLAIQEPSQQASGQRQTDPLLAVEVLVSAHQDRSGQEHADPAAAVSPVWLETKRCVLATGLADAVRLPADETSAGSDRSRAAAGRGDPSSNRIGVGGVLGPHVRGPEPGRLVMAVAPGGYCGLVRLPDGRVDVAAAIDRRMFRGHGSPAAAVTAVLDQALGDHAAELIDREQLAAVDVRATPPLTRALPLVVGGERRILRIGDAAGYVEPFTGEGIGWSLASARLLAESLLDATAGLRPARDAAARYEAAHRKHVGPLHRRCRRMALALRRPLLVAAAVRAARYAPWAASRLVPIVIGAAGQGEHDPWA
ncbi:MAG: NAD(P)/FAD-dependent oxidoreductase [Actinomycetota bacterium]